MNRSDDLISRQDAMAYPLSLEHYDREHGDKKFILGVESYRDYIEHLPSKADRPKGEWTNEGGKPVKDKFCVYCSNCKEWSEYATDFCPNCGCQMFGADMRAGEEYENQNNRD